MNQNAGLACTSPCSARMSDFAWISGMGSGTGTVRGIGAHPTSYLYESLKDDAEVGPVNQAYPRKARTHAPPSARTVHRGDKAAPERAQRKVHPGSTPHCGQRGQRRLSPNRAADSQGG